MAHEDGADRVAATAPYPPPWDALLPPATAPDGLPGVAHGAPHAFADALAETRALTAGETALIPLVTRAALRVTGNDRIEFLHGQVSHDVRTLAAGEARQALLLDHRGRPQGDVILVRRAADVYVSVDDARGTAVRRSLEAHVIFDQVVIEDVSGVVASFVVAGEAGLAALARRLEVSDLPSPGEIIQVPHDGADVLVHARGRGLTASLDVHVLAERLPALWGALLEVGARLVGERALAALRVSAGLAAAAFEGAEALPQEAGLEDRISYRKGCYLGQEIMARVEARGNVRRSLARIEFAGIPDGERGPELRTPDGRVVGRIGTVARSADDRWRGLAVVRTDVGDDTVLEGFGVAVRVAARP